MLFSILRQRVGRKHAIIELPLTPSAGDVLDALVGAYPALAPYRPVMRLAVNHTYVGERYQVAEGDELAVITPVSGG